MIFLSEPPTARTLRCKLRLISKNNGGERFAKLVGIFGMLLLATTLCLSASAGQSVTLTWDANSDPAIAGYNVYYGSASGDYTNVTSAGDATSVTISGLIEGATYYFAVTAFDAFGNESGYSGEAVYTVPAAPVPPAGLQISTMDGGLFQLTCPGIAGHIYEIQASTDLVTWTTISTQAVDASGSFEFTDYDAPDYPARFYRTRDIQP